MVSKNQDKDGNLVMKIEGSLSAYDVGELKNRLLTGLTNYQGIVFDINGVTDCDTLGVQLLLSAKKTADKLNKTFHITGYSQSIQDAVTGVGLKAEDFLCFSKEA
ncbi:MAG: STAS domain-containing protein [Desulfobacter postgatei]|uniref:Anti-anti-sigma regulatory factor (Antagonist of anti-sigma factor) n=1 Tax=Desulfobacter postgatei 2ac9 TaxID=879212 RepID=I5B2Z7_9BACT|nr:STAS domain-containing protein [Desulfobacter postgatei]EIM63860.1 anti-anti-sigma regulatory factor (antagonist of anti-sigma factor) [Desulfobacter postgatei 2ac9]MDD4275072.1 STAS domain-containing protein [Desulfobacter postgatei]